MKHIIQSIFNTKKTWIVALILVMQSCTTQFDVDDADIEVTDSGAPLLPYIIEGTISGLAGSVTLQVGSKAAETFGPVPATFMLPKRGQPATAPLSDYFYAGEQYDIKIITDPKGILCTVSNGLASMNYFDFELTPPVTVPATPPSDIFINCATTYRKVGVQVTGLKGGTLTLQNTPELPNAPSVMNLSTNGTFYFSNLVLVDYFYKITNLGDPIGQTCLVTAGPAFGVNTTLGTDHVADMVIDCIDTPRTFNIDVAGSTGATVLLSNNGVALTPVVSPATISMQDLTYNDTYNVTIDGYPITEVCYTTNGTGSDITANVTVNIICDTKSTISGTVTHGVGPGDQGTTIIVRAYTNATEILNHIAETSYTVPSGALGAPAGDFTIDVPAAGGPYVLRAWREGDPASIYNDGQPTINNAYPEPQSLAITPVNGGDTLVPVPLQDTSALTDYFDPFRVFTYNVADYATDLNGECGGYYLRMETYETRSDVPLAKLTTPKVITPDNNTITMYNDGGCNRQNGDNSSSSYDQSPAPIVAGPPALGTDDDYTFGIDMDEAPATGDYTFYYRSDVVANGYIHVQTDNISSFTKLSMNFQVNSPNGVTANILGDPTITWDSVPNANSYELNIRSADNGATYPQESAYTTTTSHHISVDVPLYTLPAVPLPTIPVLPMAYSTFIIAFDAVDPTNQDIDAVSISIGTYFVSDNAGGNTVTISGTLTNNTSYNKPIYIYADGDANNNQEEASVKLPPGSTAYSLTVLKAGATGDGTILAVLDAANNGDPRDLINSAFSLRYDQMDTTANAVQNLVWNMPVILNSPINAASNQSIQPAFNWQSYATYAPAKWSYIIWMSPSSGSGGFPSVIWGMPNTATSFDFTNPLTTSLAINATGFDVKSFSACLFPEDLPPIPPGTPVPPGTWTDSTQTCGGSVPVNYAKSLIDLSSNNNWDWSVYVIECDFNDYINQTDIAPANGVSDYTDCATNILMNQQFYATGESRQLSTN